MSQAEESRELTDEELAEELSRRETDGQPHVRWAGETTPDSE